MKFEQKDGKIFIDDIEYKPVEYRKYDKRIGQFGVFWQSDENYPLSVTVGILTDVEYDEHRFILKKNYAFRHFCVLDKWIKDLKNQGYIE